MVSLEYAKYSSVSGTKYEYINIEQLQPQRHTLKAPLNNKNFLLTLSLIHSEMSYLNAKVKDIPGFV